MKKCIVCNGGTYDKFKISDDYKRCNNCNTLIRNEYISKDVDFYTDTYFDKSTVTKILVEDKGHYDRLFTKLSTLDTTVDIDFSNIDRISCYGGGYPKLESYIGVNDITVYDLVALKYKDGESQFRSIFTCNDINIDYKNFNITDNFNIDKTITNEIITFVHVLEHLKFEDIESIFNDLRMINNTNYIIIYQPNPIRFRSNNWIHHNEQHITLIPFNTMQYILTKFNFNILFKLEYDDDMMFIFTT